MTDELKYIDSFNSVTLSELDTVKLMNRYDTKYLLRADRVTELLSLLKNNYKVLEVNGCRISSYDTTYLDTNDFILFHRHVTGREGRVKVRFRKYNLTGTVFLEIKEKTKKDKTVKWRINNSLKNSKFDAEAIDFINNRIDINSDRLKPVLNNSFKRITLAGFSVPERITIDLDLAFSLPSGGRSELPYIAVVELKSLDLAKRSSFSEIIRPLSIHPTGFSKYCIGSAILYDLPKKNIIKPKILLLNRIENEYYRSLSA